MRNSPRVVINVVANYIYIVVYGALQIGIEARHSLCFERVREIPRRHFGVASPTPIYNRLPACGAARSDRIPDRRVVAEIIGEVRSATRLVEDRDGDVGVQIGEVDGIRTASERTEGGSAGRDLGRGNCGERKGEKI